MASLGHEPFVQGPFVQPASFLRPRGFSQPMTPAGPVPVPVPVPESALERGQRIGLVSCSPIHPLLMRAHKPANHSRIPC